MAATTRWKRRSTDNEKISLHYELDRSDIDKNEDILKIFNHNSSLVDRNFFGTQITIIPIYSPFQDDEYKSRVDLHVKKQQRIGEKVRSCTISGVQVTSWVEGTMQKYFTSPAYDGWKHL